MKLPTLKKILREDIKGLPDGINPIIDTFNSLAENTYQAFNRNITFNENIRCFVKELTYKTTSSYPVEESVEFVNDLKVKATGVILLQAVDRSTYEPAAGPVYVPWTEVNGNIVIRSITGLVASKTYTIRILVI